MRSVDIHLSSARFGESLGDMRRWLDHYNCAPAIFETASAIPGTVSVRVEFREDEDAEAFEQAFAAETEAAG
jgi:hypothetical protein